MICDYDENTHRCKTILLCIVCSYVTDMSYRCLMLSGYWEVDPKYHWSNTTGGIVNLLTGRKLSLSGCAAVCMYNSDCLMFGYSNVTGTCRGFWYLEHNIVSILEESEVIFKHTQCCHLAGYMWMQDGPLCVKLHHENVTWYNATIQCEQDHGRLAILDDAKKFQAYHNYGVTYTGDAWIGISDQETEGVWVWLNGADLDTSYWSLVELNDYSWQYLPDKHTADCGIVTGHTEIRDDHCLKTLPYLCQRIDLE
ncbi:C-type lectin BfL-1-like [Argopecten irradians]|uniref:C-type lectin BfL-1-like n=1 Tax=Argopecten irradians TaxID=31199 RepID=UPI003722D4FF